MLKLKTGSYREWNLECVCGYEGSMFLWNYDFPVKCPSCELHIPFPMIGSNPTVFINTDDIPGGIEIRHGICNPDGSPKRYYSKTDIKRAANEKGVTILGDTPKPYPVRWSGKKDA